MQTDLLRKLIHSHKPTTDFKRIDRKVYNIEGKRNLVSIFNLSEGEAKTI